MEWCVSPEVIARLAELGVLRPYMLIVVTHGQDEMSRQLFPLKQGVRYVRFFTPGKNTVHAAIVWRQNGSNPGEKIFKRDDYGDYRMGLVEPRRPVELFGMRRRLSKIFDDLCSADRDLSSADEKRLQGERRTLQARIAALESEFPMGIRADFSSISRLPEEAAVELDIDEAHFATAEDNHWITRKLAGLYPWDSKPVDPCRVRARALFTACTLPFAAAVCIGIGIPVLAVVAVLNLLIVLALLLAGMRGISYEALLRPWAKPPRVAWEKATTSVWLVREVKETGQYGYMSTRRVRRPFIQWALTPPPLLVVLVAEFLLFGGITHPKTALAAAGIVLGIYVVVVLVLGTFLLVWSHRQQGARSEAAAEHDRQTKLESARLRSAKLTRELNPINCTTQSSGPRQSFVVRFEGLKSAVCQPFARKV